MISFKGLTATAALLVFPAFVLAHGDQGSWQGHGTTNIRRTRSKSPVNLASECSLFSIRQVNVATLQRVD